MGPTDRGKAEGYAENVELQTRISTIQRSDVHRICDEEGKHTLFSSKKQCCHRYKGEITAIIIIGILVGCFTGYLVYSAGINRDAVISILESKGTHDSGEAAGLFNIDLPPDYLPQECQTNHFKQSFPDIDYSFLGYNILRGYPLSVGHDVGFTLPIFIADYSERKQSADCRYSIPRGLLVISDISCETSFSSLISQTKYEFTEMLSVSANIFGGGGGKGWGAAFSANGGFRDSTTEISTGDYVYITSSATCYYYFSKLMKRRSPKFHPLFVEWVKRLESTDNRNTYFEFFDAYGTHFPTEIVFGAKYTFEHRMESSQFVKIQESGENIGMQASFAGKFSIGGGFGMDSSERSAASTFAKEVVTKTITVGATPPANGDANAWAADVKTSPVPIKYTLRSIERLFTMKNMADLKVNTTRILANINQYKTGYCEKLQADGEVASCDELKPGVLLENTRFLSHYRETRSSYTDCISTCKRLIYCVAITYCEHCAPYSTEHGKCFIFKTGQTARIITRISKLWSSYIFLDKLTTFLTLPKAIVKGTPRAFENPDDKKIKHYSML